LNGAFDVDVVHVWMKHHPCPMIKRETLGGKEGGDQSLGWVSKVMCACVPTDVESVPIR
jgi:hypothetical protein